MNNQSTIARLLSVADAAKYLCVSERTLWSLTNENKLAAVRIGRAVRYDLQDLENFITKAKTGGLENA